MERIAITGMGVVSSLGCDPQTLWNNITRGKTGIGPIEEFDGLPVTFGGRALDFDPTSHLTPRELRHLDRYAQMGVTAGLDACAQSGITTATYPTERIGVIVGTGAGGMGTTEKQMQTFHDRGARRISPVAVPMLIVNMASGTLAQKLEARGPGMAVSSACASGGHALAMACRLIAAGDADCMVAGGVEACLTPFAVSAFAAMKALSTRNDDPLHASRPFDRERDGFVMAEGGAVFVLEKEERARARGAEILGFVRGAGMSQDAYHMVAPDPEGTAVTFAMRRALEDAGLNPEDIGYVSAHGTSTPLNDKTETASIRRVFGDHADRLMVSSTKSMTGHLIGGSPALETALCLKMFATGLVAPTINFEHADPDCDLDYVADGAREAEVTYCMNNAFGFGGQNIILVLEKGAS